MKFFEKLFGGPQKESLTLPLDFSPVGKNLLNHLGFRLTEFSDKNMWKYYEWSNSQFQFSLTYDRGYYDCDICPVDAGPDLRMNLIPLLKFLRNDKKIYNKQLQEADLSNTLSPEEYIGLLHNNYDLIKKFVNDFDTKKFESYKNFDFDYDGI